MTSKKDLEENCIKIFNHYGFDNQLLQFCEEVRLVGKKAFCEWSGYKSDDILTKGSGRVVNRNDGKTYELVD